MTALKSLMAALLFVFFACSFAARGDEPKRFFDFQYCEAEKVRFCAGENNVSDLGSCLVAHKAALSPQCKQDIERYIQMRTQAASRGSGALSSFGGPNALGPPVPLISYDGRFSPGMNSPPSLMKNGGSIAFPILKSSRDTVSLSLSGSDLYLGSPVVLDTGFPVPVNLYRMEFGSQYNHRYSGGSSLGFRASVGYAGDEPFQNPNDVTYSVNANYGLPGGSERSYWLFSIFFSNNSPIGNYVPIPGLDYLYRTEKFTGMFGFPVTSIQWTPVYPWSFSASIFGPSVQVEAGYGTIEHLQFFTGYNWGMDSYLPSQRDNSLYRLTIQEMKVGSGFRMLLGQSFLAEVQGGWAFARYIYMGQSLFDDSGGLANLDDDWYVTWSLKAKF